MSKHINSVELSAYADGEALNPQGVEAHLSDCEACRKSLESIQKVSGVLQSLEKPEIHPAFARRVLAHLEERTETRAARSNSWGLTFAGVAAMGLIIAAAFVPSFMRASDSPMRVASVDTSAVAPTLELRDEATLVAEFERVFANEDDAFASVLLSAYTAEPAPDALDADFVVMALADNEVLESVSSEWAVTSDIGSAVNSMNESETVLFKQLLAESARTELTGVSHKG